MAPADEDTERLFDEECPGPVDLGSVLVHDPIRNAANHPAIVVDAETTLSEVLTKMREAGRGAVLVVKDGRLSGIFTERDVLLRVAGFPLDVHQAAVGEHMTPNRTPCRPIPASPLRLTRWSLKDFAISRWSTSRGARPGWSRCAT